MVRVRVAAQAPGLGDAESPKTEPGQGHHGKRGKSLFVSEPTPEEAQALLSSKYGLDDAGVLPLGSGKVNRSFLVTPKGGPERLVLQFLSPVFLKSPALGTNPERVSLRLSERGMACPSIVPALDGSLLADAGGFERLLRLSTYLPGTHPEEGEPSEARDCGRALGRTHSALNQPLPLPLEPLPRGGEYTNQRLPSREDFLDFHTLYRLHPKLSLIEDQLERGAALAAALPGNPAFQKVFLLKDLAIHCDPKRDNFLGESPDYSLIDWDTVGYGDPLIDVAELCRSFAVRREPPFFDKDLAREAVLGYQETGIPLSKEHYRLLPPTIRAIALNLGRRYLADALLENYFVWDKERYPSHFEQDTERAEALFGLAEELMLREMEFYDMWTG
ncbi:MAG: phosphotransferase [Deltaproteobacteria bacterium]|nr:phosphotransferase [Deltaproteobacteria bacterium]